MSIYKRKETWWIKFTAPDGRRIQQSAGTKIKHEAQELHDTLKAQAWRVKNLGDKPRHTWQEAVVRWLKENSHKRSLKNDRDNFTYLDKYLRGKWLDEIDKKIIEQIKQEKLETGVANGTVNRILALIRAVLNVAKNEWEWLDFVPTVKLLPEKSQRIQWLTQAQANQLFQELPAHLEAMARFSLATGLRESNVTLLEWSQIDKQRRCAWIDAENSKSKKAIAVSNSHYGKEFKIK